jgi:hypothetical protein
MRMQRPHLGPRAARSPLHSVIDGYWDYLE